MYTKWLPWRKFALSELLLFLFVFCMFYFDIYAKWFPKVLVDDSQQAGEQMNLWCESHI